MRIHRRLQRKLAKSKQSAAEKYYLLRKEQTTVRLVALVFLGGVFHALILYLYFWSAIAQEASSGTGGQIVLFSSNHILVTVGYFVFSFVYSLVATISFTEKRIVSPFHVQIVTSAIFLIIIMVVMIVTTPQQAANIPYTSNVFLQVFLTFILAVAYSLVISKLLRWLTGYDGSEEELHKLTLSVGVDYDTMADIVTNPIFLATHGLIQDEDIEDENIVLLRTRKILNPRLVIVLTPESVKNPKESILSFRSYEIRYDGILKSDLAEAELRNVKNDVVGIVQEGYPQAMVKPISDGTHLAPSLATSEATKIIRPKLERARKAHIGMIIAVVVSLSIGIALSVPLVSDEQRDYSGLAGIWITVVSTIVLLVIPLVIEEKRSHRERRSPVNP